MRTITIKSWGRHGLGPFRVRVDDDLEYCSAEEAVARSVARRTGLCVVTMRQDGTALERGRPESRHYQITLGKPLPRRLGGGWSVEGELWVAIPIM